MRRYVSGDVLVVDGAAWMWRPPMMPREAVAAASRGIEGSSRKVGVAAAGQGAAPRVSKL